MVASMRARVISNDFEALKRKALAETREHVDETANIVEQSAKARSRRRTGFLASRWQTHSESDLVRIVYNDANTAHIHEYGSVFMSAQPMAVPAVEGARPRWIAGLKRLL